MTGRPSPNGHHPGRPPPANDWDRDSYRPDPNTPLRTCQCGATYLDDEPSRAAHRIVFNHTPTSRQPEPKGNPR